LSGSSPLTCLAWEALPVAYATASIALTAHILSTNIYTSWKEIGRSSIVSSASAHTSYRTVLNADQ
jgi:hypothetical protein